MRFSNFRFYGPWPISSVVITVILSFAGKANETPKKAKLGLSGSITSLTLTFYSWRYVAGLWLGLGFRDLWWLGLWLGFVSEYPDGLWLDYDATIQLRRWKWYCRKQLRASAFSKSVFQNTARLLHGIGSVNESTAADSVASECCSAESWW